MRNIVLSLRAAGIGWRKSPMSRACATPTSRSWSIRTIRMAGSFLATRCWPAPRVCRPGVSWPSTKPSWMSAHQEQALPATSSAAASWCCARSANFMASLGPWSVGGPAIAIGTAALQDRSWAEATRARLAQAAARLDRVLAGAGLDVIGGTSLFRLVRTPTATDLFHHLGRAGVLARPFSGEGTWLRFGLPASEPNWQRLEAALAGVDASARQG